MGFKIKLTKKSLEGRKAISQYNSYSDLEAMLERINKDTTRVLARVRNDVLFAEESAIEEGERGIDALRGTLTGIGRIAEGAAGTALTASAMAGGALSRRSVNKTSRINPKYISHRGRRTKISKHNWEVFTFCSILFPNSF